MSKKILILSAVLVVTLATILPLIASAKIVPDCVGADGQPGPCDLCDFFKLITNIFKFITLSLVPPLAALLALIAGFLFLTSGGSEQRVSQAKKIFTNLIIGLVVVYVSWLVINSVIVIIAKNITGFTKESWYNFNCTAGSGAGGKDATGEGSGPCAGFDVGHDCITESGALGICQGSEGGVLICAPNPGGTL